MLVGSGPDGSAPVRERLTRLGPDGIVGLVDEPIDLADAQRGPGRCRGWSWSTWPPSTTSAPGGAGSSGPGAGPRSGYRVVRIDQSGVGDSPTRPGREDDRAFAPEWIDDMRHVVTELAADGARVGIVGLCSGSYSAFEVAMWEHVDAVFAINPRLTLYPAAKGTPVYTDRRRAAMLPNEPFARLALRHRILAGGLWRIYREFAVWHAPLLVLWRVLRRGTAVQVIACPDDAQHFTEVYALRPLLWWMKRSPRFELRLRRRARPLAAHPPRPARAATTGPPRSSTAS